MLNKIILILGVSLFFLNECRLMRKNKQQRIKYHESLDKVKDKAKQQSLWKKSLDEEYDDIEKRREDTYRYLEGFR